jgi:hypothetical protein
VNGVSVNGDLAIIVNPGGTVYIALFVDNSGVAADPPFSAVVAALPRSD